MDEKKVYTKEEIKDLVAEFEELVNSFPDFIESYATDVKDSINNELHEVVRVHKITNLKKNIIVKNLLNAFRTLLYDAPIFLMFKIGAPEILTNEWACSLLYTQIVISGLAIARDTIKDADLKHKAEIKKSYDLSKEITLLSLKSFAVANGYMISRISEIAEILEENTDLLDEEDKIKLFMLRMNNPIEQNSNEKGYSYRIDL